MTEYKIICDVYRYAQDGHLLDEYTCETTSKDIVKLIDSELVDGAFDRSYNEDYEYECCKVVGDNQQVDNIIEQARLGNIEWVKKAVKSLYAVHYLKYYDRLYSNINKGYDDYELDGYVEVRGPLFDTPFKQVYKIYSNWRIQSREVGEWKD